jgi:hypothetical protein
MTTKQVELINAMNSGSLTSKKQQDMIFKILNNAGNDELKAEIKNIFNNSDFEGLLLSDEQNEQARTWLLDQWLTPTGNERKNNPFGYREQSAIENFSHCTLKGYYDAGNYYHSYFIPMYDVYTKDGYGFEYYVNGGTIHITG